MGATLKRRDGSGHVVSGFEPDFAVISFNVFCTNFGVLGRFYQTVGTTYQPTDNVYQSMFATIEHVKRPMAAAATSSRSALIATR